MEQPPVAAESPKPSAEDRRAAIQEGQKTKRRKGFIYGLLVGQLLIIGIDVAAHFLIPLLE